MAEKKKIVSFILILVCHVSIIAILAVIINKSNQTENGKFKLFIIFPR